MISDVDSYLRNFRFRDESNCSSSDASSDKPSVTDTISIHGSDVKKYISEFWTPRQRQACSIHEISYRACFKPQLPKFFIELLSDAGDIVYDPFSGRGTTVIQAGLMSRKIVSNDVNPLSLILARPRFYPPELDDVSERLGQIPFDSSLKTDIDLSMFFHERTLQEILSLKKYLKEKIKNRRDDKIDKWIAMIATNRLTGHSTGFFSVYTLPPNQAVSPERQKKINLMRKQIPHYRDTNQIILKKTKTLLRTLTDIDRKSLGEAGKTGLFLCNDASRTSEIRSGTIQLTVTSPPFLDVVQYSKDNWLRRWFNSLDEGSVSDDITMATTIGQWSKFIESVFLELNRITRPNGWVAFEVGEVRNRTVNLDEHVVPIGLRSGFECHGILVNSQEFSKTSNIWGVRNMKSGTNTNRIVLFHKP